MSLCLLIALFTLSVQNNIMFWQLFWMKTRYCLSMHLEMEVLTEMLMGMEDLAHLSLHHRQLNHHAHLEFLPMHRCGPYPFRRLLGICGKSIPADRIWSSGNDDILIAGDTEGSCMGIELNIWEWAKVFHDYLTYVHYLR